METIEIKLGPRKDWWKPNHNQFYLFQSTYLFFDPLFFFFLFFCYKKFFSFSFLFFPVGACGIKLQRVQINLLVSFGTLDHCLGYVIKFMFLSHFVISLTNYKWTFSVFVSP